MTCVTSDTEFLKGPVTLSEPDELPVLLSRSPVYGDPRRELETVRPQQSIAWDEGVIAPPRPDPVRDMSVR